MYTAPLAAEGLRIQSLRSIYGFPRSTVYHLIRHEGFPQPIKIGRISLWMKSSVDHWLAEKSAESGVQAV